MNKNHHAVIQKWLLGITAVLVLAFVFTFPTRDRRKTIDAIRMKVGAEDVVSKTTRREMAQAKIEARKKLRHNSKQRQPASARGRVQAQNDVKRKVR